MKTTEIGPFAGINNRRPDYALFDKDRGFFLRSAENVDLTDDGTLVVRREPGLIQAMSSPHSLFRRLMVRASSLYLITLPNYAETFKRLLASNAPMSYAEINGSTYFSNGTDSGRVDPDGTVRPWGLPTPEAPTVIGIAGALFAGKYKVRVSYSNSVTGEEGGVSPVASLDLATAGALRVSLPAATDGATHVNVYVSSVNGGIETMQTSVAVGTATADITTIASNKREAAQRIEAPLPAGSRIFEFNGRLCSIDGNTLYVGLPYRPGYYLPLSGRAHFPAQISIAIGNQSGIFIAADKTYFIVGGDPDSAETVRDVLPYGAVPGTEFTLPNTENIVVGWMGANGFVLATSDGGVTAVTESDVVMTLPARGVSVAIETHGRHRVCSCGYVLHMNRSGVTTYADFEFTSFSGDGYGTKADGVYRIEGDDPAAAWKIGLGRHDFGSAALKSMPAVYVGASGGRPVQLRVTTERQGSFSYKARTKSAGLQIHRIDPGKGLRDNWYELELFNQGSNDVIASVSVSTAASKMRI